MESEERRYLFKEKINDGKTEQIASKEIDDLINSQKMFNRLRGQINILNKKIENMGLKNKNLKEKLNKAKKKEFLLEIGKKSSVTKIKNKDNSNNSIPSNYRRTSLLHTKRLIHLTEIGKEYTLTDLSKNIGLKPSETKEILSFLNNYSKITFNINPNGGIIRN